MAENGPVRDCAFIAIEWAAGIQESGQVYVQVETIRQGQAY